jgi:hypothetical protein
VVNPAKWHGFGRVNAAVITIRICVPSVQIGSEFHAQQVRLSHRDPQPTEWVPNSV